MIPESLFHKFIGKKVTIWAIGDSDGWKGTLKLIEGFVARIEDQNGAIVFIDCESVVAIRDEA